MPKAAAAGFSSAKHVLRCMKPGIRQRIAALAITVLIVANMAGCSQPMDPQSSVPANLQPLVFVVAAVAAGFIISANHHKDNSSSGSSTPTIITPVFVGQVGNEPLDLALDQFVSGNVGALGQNGGAGSYGFTELGSSSTNVGSYALPSGYQPVSLTIDGVGNDWFDDTSGNVKQCTAPTSTPHVCAPAVTFNDGLGSGGIRALAADSGYLFIARDNQAGTVAWAAYLLNGTSRINGSYTYSGSGMYAQDAAVTVLGAAVSTYIVFHENGTSWTISLPGPATENPSTFNPVPLSAGNVAFDGSSLFYGLLGSATSGSYYIGKWVGPSSAYGSNPGSLISKIVIAYNGQSSTQAGAFKPPVRSLKTDGLDIYMLDSNGNLVLFNAF
jgi:hypothetical protein